MFRVLFSIPFWCFGIYAFTAIVVPRWRSPWRRTRVIAGALTHLGFGLMFTAAGAILMFARDNKDPIVLPIAGLPLIVGLSLVLIGYWLDFRRPRIDARQAGSLPHDARQTGSLPHDTAKR